MMSLFSDYLKVIRYIEIWQCDADHHVFEYKAVFSSRHGARYLEIAYISLAISLRVKVSSVFQRWFLASHQMCHFL